jgi:hypothetical protein
MFHLETYNIVQRGVQHLLQPKRHDDNTKWTVTDVGEVDMVAFQLNSREYFLDFQLKGNFASKCFSKPNK